MYLGPNRASAALASELARDETVWSWRAGVTGARLECPGTRIKAGDPKFLIRGAGEGR